MTQKTASESALCSKALLLLVLLFEPEFRAR